MTKRSIVKELNRLFNSFYGAHNVSIVIRCLAFYDDYRPERGDEVVTYRYKFHIAVEDKMYVYDGWCYKDDLDRLAIGIYSNWLLENYKIYDGESTAWRNMYTGPGNIVLKSKEGQNNMAADLNKQNYTNAEMREIAQNLIDICFACTLRAAATKSATDEETAKWVARQLRNCGFDTEPVGASWGILAEGGIDNDK